MVRTEAQIENDIVRVRQALARARESDEMAEDIDEVERLQHLLDSLYAELFAAMNLELGGDKRLPRQFFGKKMSLQKKVMELRYKKGISLKDAWEQVKNKKSPKRDSSLQKKVMELKHKKGITLKQAWKEVQKKQKSQSKSLKVLNKKMLDKMSLKKLKVLSKKFNISITKKNSNELVKKSTLLNRLKKHRSIKRILESASKMKRSKFGENTWVGQPPLNTPIELATGTPYSVLQKRYLNTPISLLSHNIPTNKLYPPGATLPSMQVSKFGQYFH